MSVQLECFDSNDRQRRAGASSRVGGASRLRQRPAGASILHSTAVPPVEIPPGHVGPVVLPGSGRLVYWTGRVAIGLRHQPAPHSAPVAQSALWVQELMLGPGQAAA